MGVGQRVKGERIPGRAREVLKSVSSRKDPDVQTKYPEQTGKAKESKRRAASESRTVQLVARVPDGVLCADQESSGGEQPVAGKEIAESAEQQNRDGQVVAPPETERRKRRTLSDG